MVKHPFFMLFLLFSLFPFLFSTDTSPLPYGINVHLANDSVLLKVEETGIKWIRIDISWISIEAERGRFDFSAVDRVVDFAISHNLSILGLLAYTPAWGNSGKGFNYPADNLDEWKNFVQHTVNRYKEKIKYWNIWNEPNLPDFFALDKDVFVQRVFLPAAQTIRQSDPAAFIVGPELAHKTTFGNEWYFWLKYILLQAGNHIDIISHHIYENRGVYPIFEKLEVGDTIIPSVKSIVAETGHGSKPFWITETGWNTTEFSEDLQAEMYLEMLKTRARKNYPQKIFFYEIIDDSHPDALRYGILRSDLSQKPACNVYRDFIAGKYPDNGSDPDESGNKKCYAEEVVNSQDHSDRVVLSHLREIRDFLRQWSVLTNHLVQIYYRYSPELKKMALADFRFFNLSRQTFTALAGRFDSTSKPQSFSLLKAKKVPDWP